MRAALALLLAVGMAATTAVATAADPTDPGQPAAGTASPAGASAPMPAAAQPQAGGPRAVAAWDEGTSQAGYTLVYNGYGTAQVTGSGSDTGFALSPRPAAQPNQTHAGLAVSDAPASDATITSTVHTSKQLRTGSSPNPWEVGWLLWHYTDDTHFYSVVLKPNGWEIGKEDPAYPGAQRYLATGSSPRFGVGGQYRITVQTRGATSTVSVNGVRLATVTDSAEPYLRGKVGLYTEDASVHFTRPVVQAAG